jgi:predicted amidophosphoribosyltransferase
VVREVMHKFKYQGKRHLLGVLGSWLAEGLLDSRLREPPPQVLVPVPLHWWKLRQRGFNQAALLAQQLVLEWERAQRLREQVQEPPHGPQCSQEPTQEHLNQTSGACLHGGQKLQVEELLQRHRPTGTQTALDRAARLKNLREAFSLRKGANVIGRHLVLVDDVLTTGATLDACAQVLLSAGAASVRALAVARG